MTARTRGANVPPRVARRTQHKYIPATDAEREEMLRTIGVASVEDLFADIPASVRVDRPLRLPPALSDPELMAQMRAMAGENVHNDRAVCFLGAGAYDHYVPSVVWHLAGRGEFLTAYTPYQAELMQGELQAGYEYQSMLCEITGMDVANASMYDGASAAAEAAVMAKDLTKRDEVLVSTAVHPEYRLAIRTYTQPLGNHLNFGGPYLGMLATRQECVRRIPGRLVGATVDTEGRRGFVLTLQTREQHIRREKASSNICTNEALLALAAAIYMASLGKSGFHKVSELNLRKAAYAREAIRQIPRFGLAVDAPTLSEFVIRTPLRPEEINRRLLASGILGGAPLGQWYPELSDAWLVCVTEQRTRAEIDRLVALLEDLR